jgi:hypothetical protein
LTSPRGRKYISSVVKKGDSPRRGKRKILSLIDLASPVIDPEDLDGPKTSRLRFKPWKQKDARRPARIIELFGKLKNGDLKKAEIVKTYFDKNSISYFGN